MRRARVAAALLLLALAPLARGQVDGPARAAAVLDALAKVPPLAGATLKADVRFLPLVVAVEVPGDAPKNHVWRVASSYGPWARALSEVFARDYAAPAGRKPAAGREGLVILGLSDPQLYTACRAWAGMRDARDEHAFFMPTAATVVVLDTPPPAGQELSVERVRPMLHAAVHGLVDACAAPGAAPPLWLVEGLAERLSSFSPKSAPGEAGLRAPDDEGLRALAAAWPEPARRAAAVYELERLLDITSQAALDAQLGRLAVEPDAALLGVAREAGLVLAWLDEGAPARKGQAAALVGAALAGEPASAAAARVLGAAPAELDAPFAAWVLQQFGRRVPELRMRSFTLAPAPPGVGEVTPGVLALPSDLTPPVGDVELEHALAMDEAARGELGAAIARLDALGASPKAPAGELAELNTERRRLVALQALRRQWLTSKTGKVVDLREDGQVAKYTVLAAGDGTIQVKDRQGRTRDLPGSALLPGTLAQQLIGTGMAGSGAEDEARGLAFLLLSDLAWKDRNLSRARAEAGPAAAALLDQRAEHEARQRLGRAVADLRDLSGRDVPAGGAAAAEREAWLARARALLSATDLPLVAAHAAALRGLAGQVLGARFDEAPLDTLGLRGNIEKLADGRVRATWEFDDASQLADWSEQPVDEDELRDMVRLKAPPPATEAVEDRWLVLRGTGRRRCALCFAAPFFLSYDLVERFLPGDRDKTIREPTGGKIEAAFEVRVCGDAAGRHIACRDFGALRLIEEPGQPPRRFGSLEANLSFDMPYRVDVTHDGKDITASQSGQQAARLRAPLPSGGFLELWHHGDRPFALRRLVVEGELDPAAMTASRAAWVLREVDALGAPQRPAQK